MLKVRLTGRNPFFCSFAGHELKIHSKLRHDWVSPCNLTKISLSARTVIKRYSDAFVTRSNQLCDHIRIERVEFP